jgi:DNA-directed RNA polymerase specialized sigma24 family protein
MDRDESFTAYVAARWSMLYRLATLLVGEDRADDLAQEALVRAYLRWPEISDHAATDDVVKQVFATTAVATEPDTQPPRPATTSGRPSLAQAIDRLLPRQRTILVLRHYELLADTEIAEALGCSLDTVRADVLALETGVDPVELRDELVRTAHDAEVPLPPTAAVLVRGRRARRRRVRRGLGWAAVTAVLVAASLALVNLVQARTADRPAPSRPAATAPRFLSMLPSGRPPRIAYSVGRSLHLTPDRQVILAEEPSALLQTLHWLFVTSLSGEIGRVDLRTGAITTVTPSSRGELVTDPGGEHVAWLAGGSGPAVVVVETVDAEQAALISDQQRFPATPRCCDNPFVVDGITADGTVIASLPAGNRAWTWATPDGGVDRVRELIGLGNGVISDVTTLGIVVQYPPSHFAFGVLQDDLFLVRGEINARQADFSDPLGHRVVYADAGGEIHVREAVSRGRSRRGSQDVRLALPALDAGFTTARWEDAEHVLLDVSDASAPAGMLVRCEVQTGVCEVAAKFDAPHLLAR